MILSRQTRESIRDALRNGISIDEAAAFFKVDRRTILNIMKRSAAEECADAQEPSESGQKESSNV